jgi:polyhydroxyalkanoate synthase
VSGEVICDFVKNFYRQNLLAKNRMQVGRETVDLRRITCPVLNLLASQDALVPPSRSKPFTDFVGSADKNTIELPAEHIGLAMGSAAQREL